jgi:hypothetical protein
MVRIAVPPLVSMEAIDQSITQSTQPLNIPIYSRYEELGNIRAFEYDYNDFDEFKLKRFSPNNPVSSRSHIIFTLTVNVDLDGADRDVKLCVLDMAGKENIIQFNDINDQFNAITDTTMKQTVNKYMQRLQSIERQQNEDGWMNSRHNYMMLLAEGRFINESLSGLISLIREHNLRRKVFGTDGTVIRNDFGVNDSKIYEVAKKELIEPMTFMEDFEYHYLVHDKDSTEEQYLHLWKFQMDPFSYFFFFI